MKPLLMKIVAIALLFLSTLLFAAPCFSAERTNDVYVIHFVLDGLNNRTFSRVLSEGKLPTIEKILIGEGARFKNAVSSFPTTSTTVYTGFVTGLLPGHSGIPHLERFDRDKKRVTGYLTAKDHSKIDADLVNFKALTNPDAGSFDEPVTIFEFLEGSPTASIYSPIRRGATKAFPKRAPISALWDAFVSSNEEGVDLLALEQVVKIFGGDFEDIPRYSLVGLYSADILGHKYGPDSEKIENVLVRFDIFLGDFLNLLFDRGISDRTYIIVSADHGMHESGDIFDLKSALISGGVTPKPGDPKIKDYDIYAASRGVASSQLYIRHDGGFSPLKNADALRKYSTIKGKTLDLVDFMVGLDATDLFIVRSGAQRAKVFGKGGKEATIECFTLNGIDRCSLLFDRSRGDPFGYSENFALSHLLDGRTHAVSKWLSATVNEKYPDAVLQLSQIFRDGRAGDAFVVTIARYGFRKIKEGNHGSAAKDDMDIPLLVWGPGVPHGAFGSARAVDVFPLLLKWFGLDVSPKSYDGSDPFAKEPAENEAWEKIANIEAVLARNPSLIKMIGVDDFVRTEILPIAKQNEFAKLLPFAEKELHERTRTTSKLRNILKTLKAQKEKRDVPRIVNPGYLQDHIGIVERAYNDSMDSVFRMQDAVTILTGPKNTEWK